MRFHVLHCPYPCHGCQDGPPGQPELPDQGVQPRDPLCPSIGVPKSPRHILRDALERLDADLSALTPAEQRDFLDKMAEEIEERLIELIDEGESGEPSGPTS